MSDYDFQIHPYLWDYVRACEDAIFCSKVSLEPNSPGLCCLVTTSLDAWGSKNQEYDASLYLGPRLRFTNHGSWSDVKFIRYEPRQLVISAILKDLSRRVSESEVDAYVASQTSPSTNQAVCETPEVLEAMRITIVASLVGFNRDQLMVLGGIIGVPWPERPADIAALHYQGRLAAAVFAKEREPLEIRRMHQLVQEFKKK